MVSLPQALRELHVPHKLIMVLLFWIYWGSYFREVFISHYPRSQFSLKLISPTLQTRSRFLTSSTWQSAALCTAVPTPFQKCLMDRCQGLFLTLSLGTTFLSMLDPWYKKNLCGFLCAVQLPLMSFFPHYVGFPLRQPRGSLLVPGSQSPLLRRLVPQPRAPATHSILSWHVLPGFGPDFLPYLILDSRPPTHLFLGARHLSFPSLIFNHGAGQLYCQFGIGKGCPPHSPDFLGGPLSSPPAVCRRFGTYLPFQPSSLVYGCLAALPGEFLISLLS